MRKFLLTLFSFAFVLTALAQDRIVSGKVTSTDDGSALPGVNVVLKGTTNGAVTDVDGKYKLSIPASGGTLVFSFIGLQTQEVEVGQRTVVEIAMASDVKQLSEVVVTGTGVATDRRKLAIAVESVAGDKLPNIPAASIDQALVGKIAGAQISSVSGSPGQPVSIQLRGINTLSGGTQPLIMVDGVQMQSTSLNSLDLSNVERIEVVQGAAAATIYGAQGANGVIQVFTKKGKQGAMRIDVSTRMSTDQLINSGDLGQPKNHSFTTDAAGNIVDNNGVILKQIQAGIWPQVTWENGPTAKNNKSYSSPANNTQWYDHIGQLFSSAKTTNINVGISGASANSDYAFSFSKLNQQSIVQGGLDRMNLTANLGLTLAKGLTLRSTTQIVYTENTTNPFPSGGAYISAAFYTWPFADFTQKDADGNTVYKFGGAGTNSSNPLYAKQFQTFRNNSIDILPSLNLHYKISRMFELDYKVGVNYTIGDFSRDTQNQTLTSSFAFNNNYFVTRPDGQFAKAATNAYNINSLVTGVAKVDFDKDLKLNFPLLSTTQVSFDWRKSQFNRAYQTYSGLPIYSPIDKVNGAQASSNFATEYEDQFITYGFLLNQRFDYKDIAGISGGFRTDYASTFGAAKTPFTFPRGDAYVNLAKLDFWSALASTLPEFKLRAAYGEAGIQPLYYQGDVMGSVPNHYARYTTLVPGNADGLYFSTPGGVGNPNLQVERTKETEFGVDLGFAPIKSGPWLNFINGSVTVWNRQSTGVIWQRNLPVSAGATNIWDNYIGLSSNGVQFNLNMDVYTGNNFTWDFNTIFGHTVSFVDNTSDGKDIPLTYGSAATYTLKPGTQIGSVFGYKALTDINQKDANGNFYLTNSTTAPVAANYSIVDGRVVDNATKQAKFTSDKFALGNTTPTFNMAFTNSFTYKDFLTFSFQIDWVYGARMYNQTKEWMYSEGLHKDYDKSVTINGETAPFTAYYKSFYDASESNGTKDYFLESSSFARLRNLSVGFDFAKFFKLQKISRIQLVLTGRNLATWTSYSGFDPEANQNTAQGGTTTAAAQNATQRGLDFWSFPNFKSYQVGLNLSF
jgi:TonB-linked SusC/RagA family outer membrane protein